MNKIVFATNNEHKLKEVIAMIPNFEIWGLRKLGCNEDIPETGVTFHENAVLKADFVTKNYQLDCFSDDSGLEVDALNGKPGVYSARFAGEPVDNEKNIEKILSELKNKTNRKASFITVVALNLDGKKYFFEGKVSGNIVEKKRGSGGFGYDPIFQPDGFNLTFAEMSPEQKSKISHRGIAISKLVSFLNMYKQNVDK